MSSTRDRILDEAWRLLERRGQGFSTTELAERCGLSRQALYLHFTDRDHLMVALVDHIDARIGIKEWAGRLRSATDGAELVRLVATMQAETNPALAPIARVVDGQRHRDPAARLAWRDRLADRLGACRGVVARLADEGRCHPDWDLEEAALFVWELTSFRVWDDLVTEAGVAPSRYVDLVTHTILTVLEGPPPGSLSSRPAPG